LTSHTQPSRARNGPRPDIDKDELQPGEGQKKKPAPEDPHEFPAEEMAALRQNIIDLEAENEKLEMTDVDSTKVPDAVTNVEEDLEQKPPRSKKAKNNIKKCE